MSLIKRIQDWERKFRDSYNVDLSTPENRRRARIYNLWFDHEILRGVWTNFFPIADGVYRSNHPTRARFEKMKRMGIRSVLNLRGSGPNAHYFAEKETCEALGLTLVSRNLHARKTASRDEILGVIDAFRTIEKPFVLHCKSGADRAGFASAIYLMVIEGRPVAEARKMLGLKYIHLKHTKTGVLDFVLAQYAARQSETGIGFEDWIRQEYDHVALQQAFDRSRGRA
ncbi:tyrosine-protein phosphatase [Pseudooceanicola sp. C21-150M6]|uniref:phosphatase domain-containing protein n=1 Tax=Pseudooceanicola sp. C21-150M6 TaxID=3434355 RepID=UPI003D7FDD22